VEGTSGGTVEATGSGSSIVLENDSVIAGGLVSIASGAVLTTTAGDTADALEANTFNAGTIDVVDDSTLFVEGHWQNFGMVMLSFNMATGAGTVDIEAGHTWTLQGGGWVCLYGEGSSIQSDPNATSGATDTLDNVDDTIKGGNIIGDQYMSIDNHTGATIDAVGDLTIDAITGVPGPGGSTHIYNAGVIETDPTLGGNITIESQMQNFGQLIANSGAIDAEFAVYNNGVAEINGSGSIEFGAEVDNDVLFGTGANAGAGTLILDTADTTSNFSGSISGFAVGDTIDLRDYAYSAATNVSSSTFGSLDGLLVLSNGSGANSAGLHLLGDYTNAYLTANNEAFQFGSDGGGGTTIKLVSTLKS
jgi:hypothetical protein